MVLQRGNLLAPVDITKVCRCPSPPLLLTWAAPESDRSDIVFICFKTTFPCTQALKQLIDHSHLGFKRMFDRMMFIVSSN